ncbi:MAG: quinone-dependent dihydroorotate dehydrogenase [Geminicoccaceae bacterium]|nr:quinone-dependent dihydroorotate dehydrogenase [Geminicoccaceae bacterium]
MTLAGALGALAFPLLRRLDAETAHGLGLSLLRFAPAQAVPASPALSTDLAGLPLAHPLGLAAGFDKNGVALKGLLRLGFAFVEAGTATLHPQAGNPRPRLFRLPADRAIVNRMGFNNQGVENLAERLRGSPPEEGVVGANIGLNKDSRTPEADYAAALRAVHAGAAYVAVNVSSPNTPGLRALQARRALQPLLRALSLAREEAASGGERRRALLLKVAPDLAEAEALGIVEAAIEAGIEGLIVANTTVARPPGLRSPAAEEGGGLSGAPLRDPALRLLRLMAGEAKGRLAFVACGGIAGGADAYARILAGASAVQVYTAFAYEGPAFLPRLLNELLACLARDGFASVGAARGSALS